MTFDLPNLIAGFILGVIANWLVGWFFTRHVRAEQRKRFLPIDGDYLAYPFMDDKSDKVNFDKVIGKVRITYKKDNLLQLHYQETEQDNVWEAVVWMETPSFGSMVWQYTRLYGREPPDEHRFDFKRCFVSDGFGRDGKPKRFFYVKGDPPFYKEAFEKVH